MKGTRVDLQHLPIEKHDRVQGLVLRGRGDLSLDGEMREKRLDLSSTHRARIPPPFAYAVKAKVGDDPHPVRLLRAAREMSAADDRNELLVERGSHRPRPYHPIRWSREEMTHSPQERTQNRSSESSRTCEGRSPEQEKCHPGAVLKQNAKRNARQPPQAAVQSSHGLESPEPQNQLLVIKMDSFDYITDRFEPQLSYFEAKSTKCQALYMRMRRLMLISSWLTPIAIFAQIVLPADSRDWWAFVPMILSNQWEEQHNYGSQWSKFRLVAENLKRQRAHLRCLTGPFRGMNDDEAEKAFVEITEKIIEGTDVNYFTLMVDPRRDPMDNAG